MLSIFVFNLVEILVIDCLYYNYKSFKLNKLANLFRIKKSSITCSTTYCTLSRKSLLIVKISLQKPTTELTALQLILLKAMLLLLYLSKLP